MHALWPLFLNTLHKEVRAKTIYVLAAALLAIAFFAMMLIKALPNGDGGASDAFLLQFFQMGFQGAIMVLGTILAAVLGCATLRSDLQTSLAAQIAALPLPAWVYVAFRILGSWFIAFLFELVFFIILIGGPYFMFPVATWQQLTQDITHHILVILPFTGLYLLGIVLLSAFFSLYFKTAASLVLTLIAGSLIITCNNHQFAFLAGGREVMDVLGGIISLGVPSLGLWMKMMHEPLRENWAGFSGAEITLLIWSFVIIAGWILGLQVLLKKKDYRL
ncbi:MAG: hypothetical protein J6Y94_07485 [Bacteriovoracaceae bacterium]|nr:hypothetical protein [Bacteriovoracaceae bacterium]